MAPTRRLRLSMCDRAGSRYDHLVRRGTLVPGLGALVRAEVVLGDEQQPGVGLAGRQQTAGDLVEIEVENGKEALQVRLLVDGVIEAAVLDTGEGLRDEVETAGHLQTLAAHVVLLYGLPDRRGGTGVNRHH